MTLATGAAAKVAPELHEKLEEAGELLGHLCRYSDRIRYQVNWYDKSVPGTRDSGPYRYAYLGCTWRLTREEGVQLIYDYTGRVVERKKGETSVDIDSTPFKLVDHQPGEKVMVSRKARSRKFRTDVFSRYGQTCAFCDLGVEELITAAHLMSHSQGGTGDPRNGLPLCRNCHEAFDRGLVTLDSSGQLLFKGVRPYDLKITRANIDHLAALPAREAIDRHRTYWFEKVGAYGWEVA